jgi:hypothetical protein
MAQSVPVYQMGTTLQNDLAKYQRNGEIRNSGGIAGDNNGVGANPFSVTDYGQLGFCSNSAPTSGPYAQICLGHDPNGDARLSIGSLNGAPNHSFLIDVNGVVLSPLALGLGAACQSIVSFGGLGDNVADNTPAWNTAKAASSCVSFPPGRYYFAGPISYTMASASAGVQIVGAGSGSTFLRFATGDGLTVNFHGPNTSAQISGLTITTDAVNTGSGIKFVQAEQYVAGSYPAASQISDVFLRGAAVDVTTGQVPGPTCWANGFYTDYVSNISFINVNVSGCRSLFLGNGLNIQGGGPSDISVVYNVFGGNFYELSNGILYGPNIQGMAINTTNFLRCNYGVYVPGPPANQDQLTIVNSQFGYNNIGIFDDGGVGSEIISGNVIFSSAANNIGIKLTHGGAFTINNNSLDGLTKTGTIGILLQGTQGNGTIVGNLMSNLGTGLQLSNGTSNVHVASNNFTANTAALVSATTDNTVSITGSTQNDVASYSQVLGAVSNGATPAITRFTVQSTAGFINGMQVLTGGITGLTGIPPAQYLVSPIVVIDGTHMDMLNMLWNGGTYVSGGSVTTLP